jgi:hypothetical protein
VKTIANIIRLNRLKVYNNVESGVMDIVFRHNSYDNRRLTINSVSQHVGHSINQHHMHNLVREKINGREF